MPGDDYAEYKDKLDLVSYNNKEWSLCPTEIVTFGISLRLFEQEGQNGVGMLLPSASSMFNWFSSAKYISCA